ncbi:GAF domain-containing protein [Kovacikia minuta CCNUW1]|uniref:GAF domain-containing protein n=1 Tax=Kovacikia minuta TaxID=2931930 RepID=UPI001CCF8D6F|nr:GAF domain-containing protein [Kovacikia minuta]UBF26288.1 GAF domain-containing protein [Kovacikia minuta CCNUW1]
MSQISLEALKGLVEEEGVSDAELPILSLVVEGKPPAEMKAILGLRSENAVQKKLAPIYAKFRIAGAGPGKLAKLQKILLDRLQSSQGKRKVFIAWVGQVGKLQADGMRDLFKHPQIETFILDQDISLNSLWIQEIEALLESFDYGIICSSKESSENPPVNFAIGFLAGRFQKLWIAYPQREEFSKFLFRFPVIDTGSEESLADLLHQIIGGEVQDSKEWVLFKTSNPVWKERLHQINQQRSDQIRPQESEFIIDLAKRTLSQNPHFLRNTTFQNLVIKFLSDASTYVQNLGVNSSVFSIPLELYPRYLTVLQKEFRICVKAVAIVDSVERFWSNDEGDEIGETANKESERLFVFRSEKDFNASLNFLLMHASHYKVFVTTRKNYIPYAEEYSLRDRPTKWKEDFSLPTKEFAIIEDPATKHQLIAWYDEDNIKDRRSRRLVHFSPVAGEIFQYKEVLSNFLERAKQSQGVFQINVKDKLGYQTVPEEIEIIREELFRKISQEPSKTPGEILQDLQHLRNELMVLESKEEVIQKALEVILNRLRAQTASIFLFSKDGRLHRVGIKGIDVNRKPIENTDFFVESYAPGESFTGKAILPGKDGFGKPWWTNNLSGEASLFETSKREYKKRLGTINSAIAVPLNGQNKTYGVLEVINKIDPITKRALPSHGFLQDEVYWLSAVSSSVAYTLSSLRRKRQNKLFADLSKYLLSNSFDQESVYKEVTWRLISEDTSFKVCILRIKDETGALEVVAKSPGDGDSITWENRRDDKRHPGDGLVGQILQSVDENNPSYVIVPKIDEQIDEFRNKDWVLANQFKSFGCFPLMYKSEVVGSISLYTAYEYDFHRGCKDFLNRVASLVAAFVGRVKEEKLKDRVRKLLDQQLAALPPDLSKLNQNELLEKLSVCQEQQGMVRRQLDPADLQPKSNTYATSQNGYLD